MLVSRYVQTRLLAPATAALLSSWRLTWPARPSLDRGLLPGSTVGAPQDMAFGLWLLRGDAPRGLMPDGEVG